MIKHIKTISEFHDYLNLPKPAHPLISVIDVGTVTHQYKKDPGSMALDFYSIAIKRMDNVTARYGQKSFDFNEGILSFMSPKQVFSIAAVRSDKDVKKTGWVISIHPDFLWNTSLGNSIKKYDFWDYSLHEALFLSEKEEITINNIIHNIQLEYNANIDRFSKNIIISHIETLLNYANRFYSRQFITREQTSHQVLARLERLLNDYYNSKDIATKGLPTVSFIAGALSLSPKYLSSMLKILTGQTTQQHIHEKLIEKAKEKLSVSDLTVSEIAYSLGFEHLQSFSKFFKSKTKLSPVAFRASFN